VENCSEINVHGDAISSPAQLIAQDKEHDLALLKAGSFNANMAYFNSMRQPLKKGDSVVIIGYPKDSWREYNPVISTSTIIDTKGPIGEDKWLQFNDSLQHGNSGGPLLDSAGNVVGVVVAKAELHLKNQNSHGEETIKKSDIAISLPIIRKFLESNNINFQTMDSGIYLSPDSVNNRTRSFILSINCRTSE
jgi:S1-C subfamily serine protease